MNQFYQRAWQSLYLSHIMRKQDFAYAKTKMQISCAQLICFFVFASRVVQFLFFLNPKFQASTLLLILNRPVCVGPDRKLKDQFSCDTAHLFTLNHPNIDHSQKI